MKICTHIPKWILIFQKQCNRYRLFYICNFHIFVTFLLYYLALSFYLHKRIRKKVKIGTCNRLNQASIIVLLFS